MPADRSLCCAPARQAASSALGAPTMLNSISHLGGSTLIADDGEIGHVRQAFFDDRT